MKELIKEEEEKTLFVGRHDNECIYVVRAVSREKAMNLLNEVTGYTLLIYHTNQKIRSV